MNMQKRSQYAEYISNGIRFAEQETGRTWPEKTVIITKPWIDLAELDNIIGFPIFVTEISSEDSFNLSFPASYTDSYLLLKSFNEYLNIYRMEE